MRIGWRATSSALYVLVDHTKALTTVAGLLVALLLG